VHHDDAVVEQLVEHADRSGVVPAGTVPRLRTVKMSCAVDSAVIK
jgi:hypothetical protein